MLGKRIKWYCIAENRAELDALFTVRNTVVQKAAFGEFILVLHNNTFVAFKNKCPHQGKPLNGCTITDDHVVCPFHHYHFSLHDGRGHGLCLETYPIEFRTNKTVWIGVERWSLF